MEKQLILFNGGLSTKASPHLIQPNEAIECINVNLEKGNLNTTLKDSMNQNVSGEHMHYYQPDGFFIESQSELDERYYVVYGSNVYWSDRAHTSNGVMKYSRGSLSSVGVNADAPVAPNGITATDVAGGILEDGTNYTYCCTYVDNDFIEGLPSSFIDVTIGITGNQVAVTINPTIEPLDIQFVRIYRTGGTNPTFNLIGEISWTVGQGITTFTDNTRDIDVARIELTTFDNTPAPSNLDMLTENNGTFWGAVGNRIYFSRTGSPSFWGTLDFITIDGTCTGLGKMGNSIVAFTSVGMYRIDGFNRDTITVTKLEFNQGCKNPRSVANISSFLVWVSDDGVCLYNGATVDIITRNKLTWAELARVGNLTFGDFTSETFSSGLGFEVIYSVAYQDKYYAVYSDGILIVDISEGIRISTVAGENIKSLIYNQYDNALLYVKDNAGQLELWTLNGGNGNKVAIWTTGELMDEGISINKSYRKVNVTGNLGETNLITVFVDDTKKLEISNRKEFFLPAGSIGKTIQFKIETTGEIESLKYEYTPLGV